MFLAAAIILFIGVLIWDLVTDYRKWKNNVAVKHSREGIIRSVLLIPSLICFLFFRDPFPWWMVAVTVTMTGTWYWLLFDGIYNRIRGFNWWFTGSNDRDDAGTDNFLQSIPLWLHVTIKVAGALASSIIYGLL